MLLLAMALHKTTSFGVFATACCCLLHPKSEFADAATSVDVEHIFSQGWLLLSHIRNQLLIESTQQLMCLGAWSKMGYVENRDIRAVTSIEPEIEDTTSANPGYTSQRYTVLL